MGVFFEVGEGSHPGSISLGPRTGIGFIGDVVVYNKKQIKNSFYYGIELGAFLDIFRRII